jgi:hypothetical protein
MLVDAPGRDDQRAGAKGTLTTKQTEKEEKDDEQLLPPRPPRLPCEASEFTMACLEFLLLATISTNSDIACRLSANSARVEVPLKEPARLRELPLVRGGGWLFRILTTANELTNPIRERCPKRCVRACCDLRLWCSLSFATRLRLLRSRGRHPLQQQLPQ